VTRQLEAIERERLRALVEPDIELARSLHAEDYQLVTPGGKLLSGHEYLDGERLASPAFTVRGLVGKANVGCATRKTPAGRL
jgi:hypothetical protein